MRASWTSQVWITTHSQAHAEAILGASGISPTGAGLAGFVFHAFLFFDGAFLILQLASISGVFGICWLQHLGRLSKPKEKVAE